MRIALDSTPLIQPAGGIPRYVTELALGLAETFANDEIHLLSDQSDLHIDPRLTAANNIVLAPPFGPSFFGRWWSLGLPWELRRRRIDIFHGTDFAVPYLPLTPSVMTVHDLAPWKPFPLRPPGSNRVRTRAPRLFRLARRILTPTQAIRRELAHEFSVREDKIDAVPHGVRSNYREPSEETVTAALDRLAVPRPYLLYVGSGEPRKNLDLLRSAWSAARQQGADVALVEAGPGSANGPDVDNLYRVGRISDDDLSALLSGAAAFFYPSRYEGFGLPVIEAMQAGAPVIASREPALVEVAGGAAAHCDPSRPEEWTRAILRVLSDADWASELRSKGRRRAAELTWRRTAEKTRAVYERAIRQSG